MANEKHLAKALAGDKFLTGADLRGADLRGADLSETVLRGAILASADLTRANLASTDLREANLIGANLTGANLTGASLGNAQLRSANLTGAILASADLRSADMARSIANAADLYAADLRDADIHDADFSGADFRDADLGGANLYGANLSGAGFASAILGGADLTRAVLTNVDFSLTDLDDVTLTYAIGYVPAMVTRERRRTSGRATGAALKFAAPDAPVDPREFKKRYPKEFDLLARRGLAGRPFRPEAIAAIQQQLASPVEWVVTKRKYKSDAQRRCSAPNDVLLLNIDLGDSALTERQRTALRKLAEVSRRSGHPHEKDDLFTVGWVRYCVEGIDAWLIEEVQSDVQVARTGLKDPATRTKLASAGIDAESFEEAVAALAPYTEAFYHDAIGLVFEMAKAEGVEVEMLEYEAKREFGSPRGIYTDLPREMGMQLREGSRVLSSDGQVWAYRPNPPRKKRRPR